MWWGLVRKSKTIHALLHFPHGHTSHMVGIAEEKRQLVVANSESFESAQ